jgi:UDP-glucuronate 4-epimerase
MRILVTGTAGFIGAALALRLLERGDEVVGIDCLDPYYDVGLKKARLARLTTFPGFTDLRIRLEDRQAVAEAVGRLL